MAANKYDQQSASEVRSRFVFIASIGLAIAAAATISVLGPKLIRQEPTVVDVIEAKTNAAVPVRIFLIRFGGHSWPYTHDGYASLQDREEVAPEFNDDFFWALSPERLRNSLHANHPSELHRGIMLFAFADGESYYVLYSVCRDQSGLEFVYLTALPRGSTSPHGQVYYSRDLLPILSTTDPWYPAG
jgi:hypothetical protein